MKGAIYRNSVTDSGYTTVLPEKNYTTLVFKNIPAQICSKCGEEYISSEISRVILRLARAESGR